MMYPCKALLVRCVDFRFVSGIHTWMSDNGYQDAYDLLSIAGAIKDLVGDDLHRRAYVLGQITFTASAHGYGEIIFMNHGECGAYANDGITFDKPEEERLHHKMELRAARALIEKELPGLRVVTKFIYLGDDGNPIIIDL